MVYEFKKSLNYINNNTSEKYINILEFIDLNKINKPPYSYEGLLILDLLFLRVSCTCCCT